MFLSAILRVAPLLLVLFVGLALRLYRLREQSIWFDEFYTVCNLSAPDPLYHHAFMRLFYTDQAFGPLYYALQYTYALVFGTSLPVLRLLSIAISALAICSAYSLGCYFHGRVAGWVTALCLALSPQHIWAGQEPRAYELVTLLVILSSLFLFRALRERRFRWWVLHFGATMLLPWTHACAVFFLPVEGLAVLLVFRRRFRKAVLWTAVQFLLLTPWAVWMLLMPPSTNDQVSPGISARSIGLAVFAGEGIMYNTSLLPAWKTNPPDVVPNGPLLGYNELCTHMLVFVLVAAVALEAFRIRKLFRPGGGAAGVVEGEYAVFVVLLAVLPGLTLGLLEMLTRREILQPPYSLFGTVGLAIAVGASVVSLPWRSLRVLGVLGVVILYGYQLVIFLPGQTRANWRGAAEFIKANAQPRDRVVNLITCLYPQDNMRYYLDGGDYDLRTLNTFEAACNESVRFFQEADSTARPERSVWVAFETFPMLWSFPFDINAAPQDIGNVIQRLIWSSRKAVFSAWEKGLTDRGLRCTCTEFPGHLNLVVLRIQPAAGSSVHASSAPVPWLMNIDYTALLDEIHVSFASDAERQQAIRFLREQIPSWPQPKALFRTVESINILSRGRPDLAEGMARRICEQSPRYALPPFVVGLALSVQGRDAEAEVALSKALSMDWALRYIYGRFVRLLREHDYPGLKTEEARIAQMGFNIFQPGLRAVVDAKSAR